MKACHKNPDYKRLVSKKPDYKILNYKMLDYNSERAGRRYGSEAGGKAK
jgi:hypothetical protein